MAAPTSGQLTGAGYTLSNGIYSKTFGSIFVSFTIATEPSGGLLSDAINGDTSATDAANAQASIASLGYAVGSGNNNVIGLNGLQSYSQSL
jgi:hypothetical protein